MVGEGVCYTFCCCLEVEWGEVLFTVKYPVDPIPEVTISSLLALLYLTSFMNPMTRRWKDEYRSQIGKSANKYRAGKKKTSEETTPPCVQVLYERVLALAGCPEIRRTPQEMLCRLLSGIPGWGG